MAVLVKEMRFREREREREREKDGSAETNPHALRSAGRREEVVANGMTDNDEWAPLERPDEIATAELDKVMDNSIKRFALRRGTIQCPRRRPVRRRG